MPRLTRSVWPIFSTDSAKVIDLESSEALKYAGNPLMDQEVYHPLEYIPESKKDRRWLIFLFIAILLILSAAAIGFYLFAYIPHKEENQPKPEIQHSCSIYGPDFGPIEVNATILSIENGQVSYSASLLIRYLYCSVEEKQFYIRKEKQLISIGSYQQKTLNNMMEETRLYDSSKTETYTFTDSFELENIDSYNWLYEIVDITSHYKASLTENGPFASVVFYDQFFINFDYNQLREHSQNQKDEDFNEEYDNFDY